MSNGEDDLGGAVAASGKMSAAPVGQATAPCPLQATGWEPAKEEEAPLEDDPAPEAPADPSPEWELVADQNDQIGDPDPPPQGDVADAEWDIVGGGMNAEDD
jgi:hypothetical protein